MFRFMCATGIVLNTAMFVFNVMTGYHSWAWINIGSALLCWLPFITPTSEDKKDE